MRNTRRRELVTTRRALVLAGGGLAGIAWETGVLRGIADESPAAARLLLDSDVLVGTSAGATVAAQISSGCPLDTLYERQLAETSAEIDPGVDIDAITDLFLTAVTEPHISTRRRLQRIGAVALAVDTVPESVRRQVIAQRLPSHDWPDRVLRVTAIDIATGELVVFHRESNVALVDAVAASCSVPGAWPPVTIAGRRYMDGGWPARSTLVSPTIVMPPWFWCPPAPTRRRPLAAGRPRRSRQPPAWCLPCSPTTTRWRLSGPTRWIRSAV